MNDPSSREQDELLVTLEARFAAHGSRHPGLRWAELRSCLARSETALRSLHAMEQTGGEPDVIGRDEATGRILFCDCSAESPAGRRSLCFDREALDARKQSKPVGSAEELAAAIGIELLDEAQYRALQELGEFDRKTSSWLRTPSAVRELGGALFGDRRYGRVFVYHNGAESYFAARGFRGLLRV
ncbi:MAG: DUF4256 domain-containing protein [Planctomycetes bacterium]|nr:DUF4256 domain-containing protein [Planctomycetota bacterium]